jgi:hypothetical protein
MRKAQFPHSKEEPMVRYTKPGTYLAICNGSRFESHYTVIFEYPKSFIEESQTKSQTPDATWYFLNRVNFGACVEAVYPIEIFHPVVDHHATKRIEMLARDGVHTNTDDHDI